MITVRKILVVTLSNLGDAVLTLPVFQALHQAYPRAQMHALVSANAKTVLENDARIQRLIDYDKKKGFFEKLRLLRQIRHERYDVIIDLRRSFIGLFGGAKVRNNYFKFMRKNQHRVDGHSSALKGIVDEGAVPARASRGWLSERIPDGRSPAGFDPSKRLIVAAVGSKSDIKKWPAGRYAGLLDRLAFDNGCRIALVGDKNDIPDAVRVKQFMRSEVSDLTGRTSFEELLGVISQASLVITNDSAPLHIADSLKIPVLAIFGPTDPRKYGPRTPGSLAVSRLIFCSPCEKAQCRFQHECLKDLSAEEVYQKALRILDDRTRSGNPKILVVRLDRIGDAVLSLPAIQELRNRFPDALISVLLRPQTQELLEGHPAVDEVIAYDYEKGSRHSFPFGYFQLLEEIIRRRFDVAFILHPGIRSTLLPFLAGIPYRIGYKAGPGFLLSAAVQDNRRTGQKHESDYALDMVRAFPPKNAAESSPFSPATLPRIFVSGFESDEMRKRLAAESISCAEEKLIAVHPGASCPSKRWGLERFEILAKQILKEFPHRLVMIGGNEEVEMGRTLTQALGKRAMDFTGKLSLKELAALLGHCELLLSNDSGPVHVAAAVGTPVISLFGRNQAGLSPRRWRPLGSGHAVIQKEVGCVVCLAHECTIEFECLKAIGVEDVLNAVRKILAEHVVAR